MGAAKYKDTFYSDKGHEYKVEIWDSLNSSAAVEVSSLAGGFKLSYESESDDINQPIKASALIYMLKVEDSTMETYIVGLVDRPYGDIHINVYKDGDLYWTGTVNTALIKIEHTSFPYAVELSAIDGLGDLTKLKFDDSNMGILSEGSQYKLTQFFADILNQTGNTTFIGSSNLFTTASPIYETQSPTTDDVFNRTYLYTSAFTDQKGTYNLNYHQVLTQLLAAFNCRIMLANGKFRIIDNRFYDYYTSWKEFVYNSSGVQQSSSTFNNSVTYGAARKFLADPINEFDPGLKYVEVKQIADFDIRLNPNQSLSLAYGSSGSALFDVRRQKILGVDASGYSYSPLVGGTNKKLRLQFTIENKGLDPKKLRWVNVIIQVTDGVNSKRLSNTYNSFTGINGTTKNPDPYQWVTPSTSQGINIPFSQGQKGQYVIDLPDLPFTNCSIEYLAFMIMGDYDIIRSGNIFSSSYNITNLDCTGISTGMVVQDFDVPGRIQVSPAVTLTTVTATKKLAVMNTLYTGAAGFRNIGFLETANDIQSGDESSISLTINSFTYLPSGVNVDNEGYIYSSTNDDAFVEQFFCENIYFGDGFNIRNKNTLMVSNGFTIVPSSDWTIKPALEVQNAAPLLQKLTQSVLWHQYKGLKRYSGTIYTDNYEPYQAIIKGSEKLVFVGGELVAGLDEWSGSWAVWQYRPDAYVSSSKGNGTKASNTDITKDIYPHIDLPVLDDIIKVIDSVVGNMGASLAVYRQMVMDAEKISLDYIGADPQFKIQTSGSTITATSYKENDIFFSSENGKIWQVQSGSIVEIFQAQPAGSGITGSGTANQIAYFNGTNTIASLGTGTYPSLAELAYVKGVTSAIQTQIDSKAAASDIKVKTSGQLSSAVTLGNTTSQTLLHTITIAAGTLAAGDSVKCLFFASCNNNSNSKVLSVTINNGTSSMSGQMTFTAHTGGIMEVTFKITSLTNIRALNMSNNASYGIITSSSPRNYTVSDISANSFTIDIYGQKITSGSDTLILEHAVAIIQKS